MKSQKLKKFTFETKYFNLRMNFPQHLYLIYYFTTHFNGIRLAFIEQTHIGKLEN